MPEKNKPTKDEHFVPRVYLRGFSDNGKSFFAYNMKEDKQIRNCSIETATREKNIYEFKGNNNQLLYINLLEDTLSKLEGIFAKNRKELLSKASYPEYLNTKCFFTSEEKAFWKVYIVTQMLRTPMFIDFLTEKYSIEVGNKFTNNEIRNFTLMSMLPFFKEIINSKNNFFNFLLSKIDNSNVCAFVDNNNSLFTSDNPVAFNTQEFGANEIDIVYFPVTPHIALVLFGGKLKNESPKNQLCIFNNQQLNEFKLGMACAAQNMIYSKFALSADDIELIKKARRINKNELF